MSRPIAGLAARLVALLLALHAFAGLAVCRGMETSGAAHGESVPHGAASHHPDPGAPGPHHSEAGHHDCPETFLLRSHEDLSCVGVRGLATAPPPAGLRSPTYDVPPPVPIG
ncbi:MAG: hypothetical protein HGA98_03135 [Deltaproteobacteria bacterium]|nr:hypothetical protein [Deltaproteobacteria bacterium]